jgi:hypothetical protein
MKLNELIMKLQAIEAEHGDIEVFHHDCEHGIEPLTCALSKVLMEWNGNASGYLMHWDAVDAEHTRAYVAKGYDGTAYAAYWAEMSEARRAFFDSEAEYLKLGRDQFERKVEFLRRYDAAAFSVVF